MRVGLVKAALLHAGLLAALCVAPSPAASAAPVDDAIALYRQRRYDEARAALESLVASDPSNAAACYYLAMTFQRVAAPSRDSARTWLAKAVRLAPGNEVYLAEYAGVTLLMAGRDNSFTLAMEGRDAMAKAVAMNPSDINACEELMRFCARAPWPLGSPDKALALADQIAKLDRKRGLAAYRLIGDLFEKEGRTKEALSASQAVQSLARPDAK